MARKKREFTTFNLSFLDIMSCGFGAVILVFLIMNHGIVEQKTELNEDLLSEVNLLNEDVTEGTEGLVRLRNTLSEIDLKTAEAQGLATQITQDTENYEAQIDERKRDGYTDSSDIEGLKAELASVNAELEDLKKASQNNSGNSSRKITGDGSRQYLTGLNLTGDRIAILLDVSASMLADSYGAVDDLRYRYPPSTQRAAAKWTQSRKMVEWLTANLPLDSDYQVITFNTEATFALPDTRGEWLKVADQPMLYRVADMLGDITPNGGTSLINAFITLKKLAPPPDNVILITDGFPTQGKEPWPSEIQEVTWPQRKVLYESAIRADNRPNRVPINIILAPMVGNHKDIDALWQLARETRGSITALSRDEWR